MMRPAYTIGMLDAMVKSGAVPPDYARGAASVLCKAADGLDDAMRGWLDAHPGKDPAKDLTEDDAVAIVDNSRGFWTQGFRRAGYNVADRFRRATSWWGSAPWAGWSSKDFDIALREEQNRARYDYLKAVRAQRIKKHRANHPLLHPVLEARLQDRFMRNADEYVAMMKRRVLPTRLKALGIDEQTYPERYRTLYTAPGTPGGPVYSGSVAPPNVTPYGKGLRHPEGYGPGVNLFHRANHVDPLQ